jgi:hypothetical protein
MEDLELALSQAFADNSVGKSDTLCSDIHSKEQM